MILTFVAILIILLSYMYGCFSTARVVAKSFRSLNIYRVGSGLADTENIYANVSKPLGILVGALDVLKSIVYLWLLELLLRLLNEYGLQPDISLLYNRNMLVLYGFGMLVGHCLPLTHHLRGGRGIFTYMGIMLYLIPFPTIITGVIVMILIFVFHQLRFAQYSIVILPVVFAQIFISFIPELIPSPKPYFITILIGQAVAMGLLNIVVSRRLGEF